MNLDLFLYAAIGFVAQLVDSSIGMAFGSLSSSLLLSAGLPAQSLSATVHVAEIFGGSAAAFSHWRMKNLDWPLFHKLLWPALTGAIIGAFLVTRIDNENLKLFMGIYFVFIGTVILVKTLRPVLIGTLKTHREIIGFFGGFLDAFGGAGWGEFVSSGLLLRGQEVRTAIGSLVTVEFIISAAVSAVFFSTTGIGHWPVIASLAASSIAAAPLGALVCRKAPALPLKLAVGTVIVIVGIRTVLLAL